MWLLREGLPKKSPTLVFASTRHHVEFLTVLLSQEGVEAAAVHGTMDQVRLLLMSAVRAGFFFKQICCSWIHGEYRAS